MKCVPVLFNRTSSSDTLTMAAEVEPAVQVLRGKARSWKDSNDAFDAANFSKEALRARNLRFGNITPNVQMIKCSCAKCPYNERLVRERDLLQEERRGKFAGIPRRKIRDEMDHRPPVFRGHCFEGGGDFDGVVARGIEHG